MEKLHQRFRTAYANANAARLHLEAVLLRCPNVLAILGGLPGNGRL